MFVFEILPGRRDVRAATLSSARRVIFFGVISKGRVPLICCPENDFDITVKLADIFSLNDVASVTIVTMDKPCCAELKDMVLRAVKQSRLPIPVQITNLFVDAEEVD